MVYLLCPRRRSPLIKCVLGPVWTARTSPPCSPLWTTGAGPQTRTTSWRTEWQSGRWNTKEEQEGTSVGFPPQEGHRHADALRNIWCAKRGIQCRAAFRRCHMWMPTSGSRPCRRLRLSCTERRHRHARLHVSRHRHARRNQTKLQSHMLRHAAALQLILPLWI